MKMKLKDVHFSSNTSFQKQSQDEDETDEAGGSLEALHSALLPCLSLHLHDVRPHAQARHAKVRVSALCSGLLLFSAPVWTRKEQHLSS